MPMYRITNDAAEIRRYYFIVNAKSGDEAMERFNDGEASLDEEMEQGSHVADLDFPEAENSIVTLEES